MAAKTKNQNENAEPQAAESGVLVTAAKSLGKAAGKIASLAGVKAEAPKPQTAGKLPKKNKSRLPRKQKKAARKAGAVPLM